MHRQLSNIAKSSLVADLLHARQPDDLSSRVLHQVDTLDGVHRGLSASLDKSSIQCLEAHLLHTLVTDNRSLSDNKKRGDSGSLLGAVR